MQPSVRCSFNSLTCCSFVAVPRKCSVVGCRGNYDARKGEPADANKVSTFRFPKDSVKKAEWLRRIPQELLSEDISDDMVVCERHFDSRFIIRNYTYHRADGSEFTCPREAPILDVDAVPTIFPNTPSYLSSPLPPKRKTPNSRRAEMAARDDKALDDWLASDAISSFDNFSDNVTVQNIGAQGDWAVLRKTEVVVFLLLVNVASSLVPSVVGSVKVWRDMSVAWFDGKSRRDSSELAWLLEADVKLSRWSQLPNLCAHVRNCCEPSPTETARTDTVPNITKLLKSLISAHKLHGDGEVKLTFLEFIYEQFVLLYAAQKRYSPSFLMIAFRLFCLSRSAYKVLRDTCLTLPHISYLRQLSSCFSNNTTTLTGESARCRYLRQKCSTLDEHERLCVLMLDEIYVSQKISYKGGSLHGFATNTGCDSVEATTVQAYMLGSLFSKNKDVVALQPVKNLDTSFLHNSVNKVLQLVESVGYKVVSLLSDNNRINRNVFAAICGGILQPSIVHPLDSTRQLFFLFDPVHLLKSIRNNWINQIDQTFYVPGIDGNAAKACFAHLKQLYDSERSQIVKLAPNLTFTSLHPNNLQRQNVKLALKIFDDKNVSALSEFGKRYQADVSGTQNFLVTILQFWKLMNVKNPLKGRHLNDSFCEPIRSLNDEKLHWLSQFYEWLCAWEQLQLQPRHGCLSKETFFALKQTVIAAKLLSRVFAN